MTQTRVSHDCPRCHASARPERLSLRYLLARVREEAFGSERGFARTVWALFAAPQRVVAAFLHDTDRRYFGPIKYFLVATALSILLMPMVPLFDGMIANALERDRVFATGVAAAWVAEWNGLLYAPLLVMLAVTTRLLFRARGLNLAEHLVVATYAWAQMLLVSMLAFGLASALKSVGIKGAWLLPLLLASTAYWCWFAVRVFAVRHWADAVRTLITLPTALVFYFFAILIALAGLRVLIAP